MPLDPEVWPNPLECLPDPQWQQQLLLPYPAPGRFRYNNALHRPQVLREEILQRHTTGVNPPMPGPYATPQRHLNAPQQPFSGFTSHIGPYPASSSSHPGPICSPSADLEHYNQRREPDWYDQMYQKYRYLLVETNTNVVSGRLVEASEALLKCSKLLLSNDRLLISMSNTMTYF